MSDEHDAQTGCAAITAARSASEGRAAHIEIALLDKLYEGSSKVHALDKVSLDVAGTQFVSILGPSGCGKSTLLNIVAGFEHATSGAVRVGGQVVVGPHPSRAVVFQEAALFPWLTTWENVVFGPRARGARRGEYEPLARELIDAVGLSGFENAMPAQLSGGMRQRVGIARALIMRPSVLLMDEPFGALDAQTRIGMQELLLKVWERFRKTIIFITHDMDEAILLSDVVCVMSARPGKIQRRLDIDIPRPRSSALLADPQFNRLRAEIMGFLRTTH